jgi:hypothetical protein
LAVRCISPGMPRVPHGDPDNLGFEVGIGLGRQDGVPRVGLVASDQAPEL